MIEVHPEYFLQVRVSADMQRAKREGKLGMILSFESVDMLEGKLEPLEIFRNLGIRVMQLSYNRKSPFGAGVMEGEGGGLTALGKEAVKRMNSLGITIDLSHANPQTTADVLNASLKAAIMSHAGWWSRISRIFRMSVRHWPPELMGWPTFGGKEALPRMLHDSSSRNTCLWFLRSRHQMDSSEVLVQSWPPIHD
jgi:Membrane dipeptidase (Peptidase family M19)